MSRSLHKAGIADALVVAESLASHPRVREILLFGSVAQPDSIFGNDVDLVVMVDDSLTAKPVRSAETLPQLGRPLSSLPDVLLDLIFVPQSFADKLGQTERLLGLPDGFMENALAGARKYQRDSHSFPGRR